MHAATTLVELGAIILTLSILGRLADRIGVSAIPFYLLGGLAFGDGGLLALADSDQFVEIGAEIGVALLLLMLGLEYSAGELVTNLRGQAPAGAVDMVLNALPGLAAGFLLGYGPVAALALAGVTWVSSSGVIAKVLGDLDRLGNRETPIVLGVLVIEDLSMAVYLPILTAVLAGVGLLAGSLTVAVALGAVTFVLYLALRHGPRISRALATDEPEHLLLGVLGLTLLVAGLADRLQISAAVGSFLVGIAISGEVAEHARSLLAPLRDLFAAVFFVFFGLSTDPADLPPVLLPALALALITTITKVLAGYWAAGHAGIARPGRYRAGGALVARGEFSIIIAGLAVSAGTDSRVGALATTYVLILVVAGPATARYAEPLLRRVFGPRPVVPTPVVEPDDGLTPRPLSGPEGPLNGPERR